VTFFKNLLGRRRSLKTYLHVPGLILWMTAIATLDVASLPDDPKLLKAYLSDYVQKYVEARRYADTLEHAIVQLRRMHFGPKSERLSEGQQIFAFHGTLEASRPARAQGGQGNRRPSARPIARAAGSSPRTFLRR